MASLILGQGNQYCDEIWIFGQMRRLDIPQTSPLFGGKGMSSSFTTAEMMFANVLDRLESDISEA